MRGDDNGQLTLTIGKYYRVTGESTQHRGVIPDIELPSMIDTATVGESTRDTALPWDRIQPTRFRADTVVASELDKLRADQTSRAASDPDYRYLLDDVAAFRAVAAQKTVSLNLESRKEENKRYDQARLDRENVRRMALGLEPIASVDKLDDSQLSEKILLQQAARVVAEMVAMEHPRARQLTSDAARTKEAAKN
jgi:carboxyl-terminal processing protease